MRVGIRDPCDFWAGVLFVAAGGGAVVYGRELAFGTATKMGPGYFPTVLGGILVFIGLALVGRALVVPGGRLTGFACRPLVLVLGAPVLFGLIVRGAGLVPALLLLVLLSAGASRLVRWRPAVVLAVALAAFSSVVFVRLLGLPIAVIGPWFGA